MKERNFKSLYEILQVIVQKKEEIQKMQSDLKAKSKGRLRRFFYSSDEEKKNFKLYNAEIKGKIKLMIASVKCKESYLDSLCSFEFNIATQLISEILSLIEGENYKSTNIELKRVEEYWRFNGIAMVEFDETIVENICLISTIENTNQVLKLRDDQKINSSYGVKKNIQDEKYILLKQSDKYTLFNRKNLQIPEELAKNYPYLSTIVCDLINFKLTSPSLSDKQVADLFLQQMPEKYANLIQSKKGKSK